MLFGLLSANILTWSDTQRKKKRKETIHSSGSILSLSDMKRKSFLFCRLAGNGPQLDTISFLAQVDSFDCRSSDL